MAIMRWTDDLSVGVPEIDRQHLTLINIINKIADSFAEGSNEACLGDLLPELKWYAAEHFKHEELFMSETCYPHLADHRKLHTAMLAAVDKLIAKCKSGETLATIETSEFFKEWLLNHIKVEDHKFGEYAKTVSVA